MAKASVAGAGGLASGAAAALAAQLGMLYVSVVTSDPARKGLISFADRAVSYGLSQYGRYIPLAVGAYVGYKTAKHIYNNL